MGNLYLVDKPCGENGFSLAVEDADAKVVLVQDGVYLDPRPLLAAGVDVYAVRWDVECRGQTARLPSDARIIDYGELVDLVVAHKVVNFA